jgi:hypothetical protein
MPSGRSRSEQPRKERFRVRSYEYAPGYWKKKAKKKKDEEARWASRSGPVEVKKVEPKAPEVASEGQNRVY